MAENFPFVKPPEPLQIGTGNPAHSWKKWKQKFDIYLKATGASSKSNEIKVGLLLNHIGDECLEIYSNFQFLAERDNPDGGDKLPAESPDNLHTVTEKFNEFFTKRDPQLMLREKFWFQLQREPSQSFDSWVTTVKERSAECKFPPDFIEQAVRDKLTFSCTDDRAKLKLYDVGAKLSLQKAVTILSMKEATSRELQETKSASIEYIKQRTAYNPASLPQRPASQQRPSFDRCGYCGKSHPRGRNNCPASNARCDNCNKMGHFKAVCRSTPNTARVNQIENSQVESQDENPTFVGGVGTTNDQQTREVKEAVDNGWHIKLKVNKHELTWCIDTGAQVSVMPEQFYKESFGKLNKADKRLVGADDKPLETIGQITLDLKLGEVTIKEHVYIIRGAKKLLLGIPAIRRLGLIQEIPDTFTIKAIGSQPTQATTSNTKEKITQQYPNLFRGLGKMAGEYTIQLKEGAQPFCLTSPRRIPIPLQKKVKSQLESMVQLGVIEPIDEPTDWCSPIVVVPKSNGDVRVCVDLTRLNKHVKREIYQMPKVEETLGSIAKGSIYSKLDANSGFHQVSLNKESMKLTTFITPFGRYMFKRMPYGISSAPEYFQKRMDQELAGLEGVVCHMDDILVVGQNQKEHDERLASTLDRIAESGLTLNPDKCKFSQSKIEYLGQVIDRGEVRKDPGKVKAILEMEEPKDISELRRFLGMANQLMKFCPKLAERTKPLRDLLKQDSEWVWEEAQRNAFKDIKAELASDRVLVLYNPDRETTVSADASSFGLGAVFLQKQPNGEMRPVAYASRSMTTTERRYAQIEKEALATTWALEHWSDLLIGMKFTVETDHKPLVPLFTTKLIDELPVRIQRFRMRLMRFDFEAKHVPGKLLYTADALSRSPLEDQTHGDDELYKEAECYVNAVIVNLPASDKRLDEIRCELRKDETLKLVMYYVQHGWPDHKQKLYGPINKYWSERNSLSTHEGLLLRGRRLVIPPTLRADVLRYLHDGHQGVTKTRENAASSAWWPGISNDIERMVRNCTTCEKYRKQRIEPMIGTEFPDRPWSRVAADFFQYDGKVYLLIVDYYSRDIEVYKVTRNVTSSDTISKMKTAFSRHGIPDILVSDNGPQFASAEFNRFASTWGFTHVTSSPHYPQSNGEAERAVETLKMILRKCDDEYLALLTYRNTPLHNGYSPAQLSMGRKLKTRVPCHPGELKPCLPNYDGLRKREADYRKKMQSNYDRRHRVVEGTEMSPGDNVWIPDLKTEGKVVQRGGPRSLIIETSQRRVVRRNRRMLRRAWNTRQYTNMTAVPHYEQTRDLSSRHYNPPASHIYTETEKYDRKDENGGKPPYNGSTEDVVTTEPPSSELPQLRRSQRTVRKPRRYIEEC